MPKIPRFEPHANMADHGAGMELPMDANQLVGKAMEKRGEEIESIGYRMATIQARQRELEQKALDTVDALKLEHEFKNEADAHAESMRDVRDVNKISEMTEKFIQRQQEKYDGLQVKPSIKTSILPSVLGSRLLVEKTARDKRASIIVNDGQMLWEQTKIEMEKRMRAATTQQEVMDLQKQLEIKGAELVESNIFHGADVVKDLQSLKQKVQFNRAADQIDLNPEEYLKTPNKIERYGLTDLDGTHLRELDRYALNKRDYMITREEQNVRRMQDKNAEIAYDKFKKLYKGEIDIKEWERFASSMRIPDANGNYPLRRELAEHFDTRLDNMIRNGGKITPNPKLYNYLNERLTDGKNPLTFKELDQYANQLPTPWFTHFSDKLTTVEIAEGKRGASSEKVKRAKLQTDIEKDEKTYVKSMFDGKSVDPDEMWKMNKDLEYTINKMLDEGVTDREKIHDEIRKIVEPKAHTWLIKIWKKVVGGDEPQKLEGDVYSFEQGGVPAGKDLGTKAKVPVLKNPDEFTEVFSDEEVKTWPVERMSKRLQNQFKMKKEDADIVASQIKDQMGGGSPPNELPKGWIRKGNEVFNEKGELMIWRKK